MSFERREEGGVAADSCVDHEAERVLNIALICIDGILEHIVEVALATLEDA